MGSIRDISPASPVFYLIIAVGILVFSGNFKFEAGKVIGIVIMLVGFSVWMLGYWQLGNSFAILPKAKKLVKEGVYRKIRHPIYVGLSVVLLGMAIYFMSLLWLVAFVLITVMDICRAIAEEKVLSKKFGKEYAEYRKTTWF